MSSGPIEAGTALVSVPRRWVFSLGAALAGEEEEDEGEEERESESKGDDDGQGGGGGGAFRAAVEEESGSSSSSSVLPPEVLLACYLLLEAWKVEERAKAEREGEKEKEKEEKEEPPPPLPQRSRWRPYLGSLPSSYPLLMQTVTSSPESNDSLCALFCGIPAAQAAAEQARAEAAGAVAEAAVALVARAASKSLGKRNNSTSSASAAAAAAAAASAFAFAKERFPWARASVRSRAMFFADEDDIKSSDNSPSFFASAGALLPFGDLFNHAHAPAPEEPDTGGGCDRCSGWHGEPGGCESGRGEEEEGGGEGEGEEKEAVATATMTGKAEEPLSSSSCPLPLPLSTSWGDGAFDPATSEFVVRARSSYGVVVVAGGGGKGAGKESGREKEKERRGLQISENQIFLTYSCGGADADNLALLANYGFVDPLNPHDRAFVAMESWERVARESERALREETQRRGRRDNGSSNLASFSNSSSSSALLRWRSEALKLLLSSSSSSTLAEEDSWCHSLSGCPGWNLLAALRSSFLATEVSSFPSPSSSSTSSSSPSLSLRRAAVASGASPGAEVDAAAFSTLAEAAREARELARAGDAERERILERAAAEEAQAAAEAAETRGVEEEGRGEEPRSISEGLLAAASWRRCWSSALERVVRHAGRVAGAAAAAAEAEERKKRKGQVK